MMHGNNGQSTRQAIVWSVLGSSLHDAGDGYKCDDPPPLPQILGVKGWEDEAILGD